MFALLSQFHFFFYKQFALICVCVPEPNLVMGFFWKGIQRLYSSITLKGKKRQGRIRGLIWKCRHDSFAAGPERKMWFCFKIVLCDPFCICGITNQNSFSKRGKETMGFSCCCGMICPEHIELIRPHDSAVSPFITLSCYRIHYLPSQTPSMMGWEAEVWGSRGNWQ